MYRYGMLLGLALGVSAQAQTTTLRGVWGDGHVVAIGARLNQRVGEGYAMASAGGHVRLAPFSWLRGEFFLDNYVAWTGPAGMHFGDRHDHEIGFLLQTPLVKAGRFSLFPMLGACVVWAVASSQGASVTDVRFGVHGGLGAQAIIEQGLSAHLEVEAIAYNGHALRTWDFSASVAPQVSWFGVGQVSLGLEYWF